MFYGVVFIEDADLPGRDALAPLETARDVALALLAEGLPSAVVSQGDRVTAYISQSRCTLAVLDECRAEADRMIARNYASTG